MKRLLALMICCVWFAAPAALYQTNSIVMTNYYNTIVSDVIIVPSYHHNIQLRWTRSDSETNTTNFPQGVGYLLLDSFIEYDSVGWIENAYDAGTNTTYTITNMSSGLVHFVTAVGYDRQAPNHLDKNIQSEYSNILRFYVLPATNHGESFTNTLGLIKFFNQSNATSTIILSSNAYNRVLQTTTNLLNPQWASVFTQKTRADIRLFFTNAEPFRVYRVQ